MGKIKYLNDDNFETEIAQGVTLVDFHADWCGPCRMIAPIVEELANEMQGVATIAKIDVDESQVVTSSLQVMSIPTLILFNKGKEVKRVIGVKSKDELRNLIKSAL